MKPDRIFSYKYNGIIKVSAIFLFLLSSLNLMSQTQTNFSGKWEFDKAASDKDKTGDASFNGTIILEIKQSSSTITFTSTYFIPGKAGIAMQPDSYFLDGKVTTDNSGTGPAKKSAKWSQDNKSLTTSLIMTDSIDGVAQEFLTANTYKLSDDKKTLYIEELNKSKLNGEIKVKKVYKKKA